MRQAVAEARWYGQCAVDEEKQIRLELNKRLQSLQPFLTFCKGLREFSEANDKHDACVAAHWDFVEKVNAQIKIYNQYKRLLSKGS